MSNHELTGISQGPQDYRGFISYTQENGYKMVTMLVSVTSDEHSHVTTHARNLPLSEAAEHLQQVDLYHLAVTDGTQIQLTIQTPADHKEAWYTVQPDTILAHPSPLEMTVGRSEESAPFESADTLEALDEALQAYLDQIPIRLDEALRSRPAHDLPDFGR